jgi:hypothetical protein
MNDRRVTTPRPKVTDALRPSLGALTPEDAQQKYPSGASQPVRDAQDRRSTARQPASERSSRGGRNFDQYGMVNPPPTRKPAARDY